MTKISMTVRERFHACMNFKPFDRLPIIEWAGWWDKTIERWKQEGLPVDDRYEIYKHLGMDIYKQDWIQISDPPERLWPEKHGAPVINTMDE